MSKIPAKKNLSSMCVRKEALLVERQGLRTLFCSTSELRENLPHRAAFSSQALNEFFVPFERDGGHPGLFASFERKPPLVVCFRAKCVSAAPVRPLAVLRHYHVMQGCFRMTFGPS